MSSSSRPEPPPIYPTLLGHPAGLFTLFFAEMWERFSFYGMKALLLFYMAKDFLNYQDQDGYAILGAYMSLVYMMPFFGGMLADRLLGQRRAVILGGLLMAAGHLLMTAPDRFAFFVALALLIVGNGFFKPNISTIVGSLYSHGSNRRDAGFTIFYMGVNLGAALAPALCVYVGEKFGYHRGFGLATLGMLVGVAVFAAPTRVTQGLILVGAIAGAVALPFCGSGDPFLIGAHLLEAVALLIAGVVAFIALERGGIPADAGLPPDPERLRRPLFGRVSAQWAVFLALPLVVVVFTLLVSGFAVLTPDHRPLSLISEAWLKTAHLKPITTVMLREISRPAGLVVMLAGLGTFAYLALETLRLDRVARQRMYVIFVLTFFSILFWALFEQAGSSVNNFTDRNVDRVTADRKIASGEVGRTIEIQPTQKQLGYHNGEQLFTLNVLDKLRADAKKDQKHSDFTIPWSVAPDNVGMYIARSDREIPAATLQEVNPVFILLFGPIFTAIWSFLAARRKEPSTPVKFALGMMQLGLGLGTFWYGAHLADARGMVALRWLVLGYLFQTTGELCLSPVGLSMVTKLSPTRLVSTVMGAWFLATAFAEFLASIIAQFTGVDHGDGAAAGIPVPVETVHVYGDLFGKLAIAAMVAGLICLTLAPLLKRWMHAEDDTVTR